MQIKDRAAPALQTPCHDSSKTGVRSGTAERTPPVNGAPGR